MPVMATDESAAEPVSHLHRAMKLRRQAIELYNSGKADLPAGDKALFFAMLAQFEATMEVIDRLGDGVTVRGDRELHDAVLVFTGAVSGLTEHLKRR